MEVKTHSKCPFPRQQTGHVDTSHGVSRVPQPDAGSFPYGQLAYIPSQPTSLKTSNPKPSKICRVDCIEPLCIINGATLPPEAASCVLYSFLEWAKLRVLQRAEIHPCKSWMWERRTMTSLQPQVWLSLCAGLMLCYTYRSPSRWHLHNSKIPGILLLALLAIHPPRPCNSASHSGTLFLSCSPSLLSPGNPCSFLLPFTSLSSTPCSMFVGRFPVSIEVLSACIGWMHWYLSSHDFCLCM